MFGSNQELLTELRLLIEQLGEQGGLVSPSVYDTAQVLRLYPPVEGVEAGLGWLLEQQYADGGWGVPHVPAARDIPTLAAVLALHTYRHRFPADQAIEKGLAFLRRQAHQWTSIHIDSVPIAGEVLLPYLLEQAARAGLVIDQSPYASLFQLRRLKLQYLEGRPILPNSAPTYSWEALGFPYTADVLHPQTGVGHSPAATAAWLCAARQHGEDSALIEKAEAYLARAAATTSTEIPGVVPMVYPITGFELGYGLYALLLTGLFDHPTLQDVVVPQVAKLRAIAKDEQGVSFGDGFVPDVDVTAVAVGVLQIAGQAPDLDLVYRFWQNDHFYTYSHELNPSVFSNAHALHALVLCGERCALTEKFLIEKQSPRGAWMVDKWHTSWRSSTLEVIAAFMHLGYEEQVWRGGQALIADQLPDGSWASNGDSSMLETAYSVMALQLLASNAHLAKKVQPALQKGQQWLWNHASQFNKIERSWLGKEIYSAVRVDQIYKLSAMLSPALHTALPKIGQPSDIALVMANPAESFR